MCFSTIARYAVIGGGAAGAILTRLLEQRIAASCLWFDVDFQGGELRHYHVESNTTPAMIRLVQSSLGLDLQEAPLASDLHRTIVKPIIAQSRCERIASPVTRVRRTDSGTFLLWAGNSPGQELYCVKDAVFDATGIPLDVMARVNNTPYLTDLAPRLMFNPHKLASLPPGPVDIIGGGHSAFWLHMTLSKLGRDDVYLVNDGQHEFARLPFNIYEPTDNACLEDHIDYYNAGGLKRKVAEYARRNKIECLHDVRPGSIRLVATGFIRHNYGRVQAENCMLPVVGQRASGRNAGVYDFLQQAARIVRCLDMN